MSKSEPTFVIAYDVGTTGVKTCLFEITLQIRLLNSAYKGYPLYLMEGGGAEQDPDDWWNAICATTQQVLAHSGIKNTAITAVSFCSQMQCLVLIDKNGRPVRNAMSYMDSRAQKQRDEGIANGPSVMGLNIRKTAASLVANKAVAASVKDPVWKYHWVRENEPNVFRRIHKWLDTKDYLVGCFTGEFKMTKGSAFSTLLYDTREGKEGWSKTLCNMLNVNPNHLPQIIDSSSIAGRITKEAALSTGLAQGTAVFGGGGDAELIGVGIGAVEPGETHIYMGTSGWVSTVTEKQIVDISSMIAAIVGVQNGRYHYFAEMETAGKCLEWVRDHLALDEIGIYLEKKHVAEASMQTYLSLYDYLCETLAKVPAGSNGVIFTPWLHGNRCPFEDPNARGMFFNIGLDTGKSDLIRSVIEGVAFHLRLMLEAQEKKLQIPSTIMACGGNAISSEVCQILADVLNKRIATIPEPQNVGAYGAAILMACGMERINAIADAKSLLPEYKIYTPQAQNKAVYDKNYAVFQVLYNDNKRSFKRLNSLS